MNPLRYIALSSEKPVAEPVGELETRVTTLPVWYISSPEGALSAYEATPAHTAGVVDEAVKNGMFDIVLPDIDA